MNPRLAPDHDNMGHAALKGDALVIVWQCWTCPPCETDDVAVLVVGECLQCELSRLCPLENLVCLQGEEAPLAPVARPSMKVTR